MKSKYLTKLHMTVLCILYLFAIGLVLTGCGQDDMAVQEIVEDAITEESESETEDSGADALPDIQADTEAEDFTDQPEQEKEETTAISVEDDNVDDEVIEEDTFDYSPYVGKTWVDASWDWGELYHEQASIYIFQIEDGKISGNFSSGFDVLDLPSCSNSYFENGNIEADVRNGISKFTISTDYYDADAELRFLEDERIEVTIRYERMERYNIDNSDGHMDGTFIFRPYNITDLLDERYLTVEIMEEDAFRVHTDYWEEAYLVPVTYTVELEPRKGQQFSEAYLTDSEGDILLYMEGTWNEQEFQDIHEEDIDGDGLMDIKMVIIWVPFYPENPVEEIIFRQLESGIYERIRM